MQILYATCYLQSLRHTRHASQRAAHTLSLRCAIVYHLPSSINLEAVSSMAVAAAASVMDPFKMPLIVMPLQ